MILERAAVSEAGSGDVLLDSYFSMLIYFLHLFDLFYECHVFFLNLNHETKKHIKYLNILIYSQIKSLELFTQHLRNLNCSQFKLFLGIKRTQKSLNVIKDKDAVAIKINIPYGFFCSPILIGMFISLKKNQPK